MKPSIEVIDKSQIQGACGWVQRALEKGLDAGKVIITLSRESRSDVQNKHMWALCNCFVKSNIDWPKGSGVLLPADHWKILFVSAYHNDASNMVIGLAGEVVNFNYSSKALKKPQFSELIEFIYAEGTERGVVWDDQAMKAYQEWSTQ